jgi:hypothetical protein
LAGRGFGKTRVLSEMANAWASSGQTKRIAIVAATIIENPGPASLANETVPVGQKRVCRPGPPTRQLMRTRSFHSEQHISVMRRSKSSAIEPTSDLLVISFTPWLSCGQRFYF